MKVDSVLQMPTGEQIGENRLPSFNYASDHFSLLADLRLIIWKKKTLKNFVKIFQKGIFVYKTHSSSHSSPYKNTVQKKFWFFLFLGTFFNPNTPLTT